MGIAPPGHGELELFVPIPNFSRYQVSNFGVVVNVTTGRQMTYFANIAGDPYVSIVSDRNVQESRAVKRLVADAFVDNLYAPERFGDFNTPIVLDGDREHLVYTNIAWRPRWFAINYHKQFAHPQPWWTVGPVVDDAGTEYRNIYEAGIVNGVMIANVLESIQNGVHTFPDGHIFKFF